MSQRWVLLGLGGVLAVLLVGVLIDDGNPKESSLPSGIALRVEGVPADVGTVTEARAQRAIAREAMTWGEPVPEPGDDNYEDSLLRAMFELTNQIWIQGQAAEMGISVTPEEVAAFASESERGRHSYLRGSGLTEREADELAKVEILTQKLQERQAGEVIGGETYLDYHEKWTSRTSCAPDFLTQYCARLEPDIDSSFSPSCVSADPERGRPEACEAPVPQRIPALPGSIGVHTPYGERLPQGPRPIFVD